MPLFGSTPLAERARNASEHARRSWAISLLGFVIESGDEGLESLDDCAFGSGFGKRFAEIHCGKHRRNVGGDLAIDLALQGSLDVGYLHGRATRIDHATDRKMQARTWRDVVRELLKAHGVAHPRQRQISDQENIARSSGTDGAPNGESRWRHLVGR